MTDHLGIRLPQTLWWTSSIALSAATVSTTVLAVHYATKGATDFAALSGTIGAIMFVLTIFATATPINVLYDDIIKSVNHTHQVLFGARSQITSAR
jgi:hypothetical protein